VQLNKWLAEGQDDVRTPANLRKVAAVTNEK
jgi:hypothetical protein